ncbi:ketosteroid isomerase-related protein [Ferrovibrio terrae]|uniref:ketosteroid isomerase-related protein n=1 Tax=Ferrovibrio terrae TaxID=2594003 RepID=UPI003137AA09
MTIFDANQLIQDYYDALNARDVDGFLALLTDDVVHDTQQGARESGKAAFRAFLGRTGRCYEEKVVDLFVMTSPDGTRAAAEFTLLGVYVETEDGLPEAEGQRYSRPAGAFFEIRDGRVARVSNAYPGETMTARD